MCQKAILISRAVVRPFSVLGVGRPRIVDDEFVLVLSWLELNVDVKFTGIVGTAHRVGTDPCRWTFKVARDFNR